jgi:hypothetical protein
VAKNKDNKVPGDILGLTDDRSGIKLPHPPSDGSTPEGIEVRDEYNRHRGDLESGKGATGIDMGAGGEGTDIVPER